MAITNLTNTKWVFNSEITISSSTSFDINFASHNQNWTNIELDAYDGLIYNGNGLSNTVYGIAWYDQEDRIIEITGGNDVTNANLIAWLGANATQVEVTNLTGTKWVIKNVINPFGGSIVGFNINFTSNSQIFTSITDKLQSLDTWALGYNNTRVYDSGTWLNEAYRLISITGGNDVSNPDLLVWLSQNATQVQVTDLTDTTWTINSLTCSAGYGIFTLNYDHYQHEYDEWIENVNTRLYIGYYFEPLAQDQPWRTQANRVTTFAGLMDVEINDKLKFNSGTDTTNLDLIVWLTENATLQQSVSYSITVNATNLTYSGDNSIDENGTATVTLTASSGYVLPSSITVIGASYTYNSSTGVISLSNPTGNVTITASGIPTKTFDLSTLNLPAGTHEIKVKARATGYRNSEFSNSVSYVVSPSRVTDLTGTTWRLPSGLVGMDILVHGTNLLYDRHTDINFTSNGQSFIGMSSEDTAENWLMYDASNSANSVQVQTVNGWEASDAYKTIHITGGADRTNQNLIDWLYDNATLLTNGKEVTLTITTERHPAERDIFRIYDGQNTTGTLLYEKIGGGGSEYVLTPQTLICTSGYLYIELQGPGPLASGITTTGGVTGDTQIPHYGVNTPFEVTGNGTITIGDLDWDT